MIISDLIKYIIILLYFNDNILIVTIIETVKIIFYLNEITCDMILNKFSMIM